MNYLGYSWLERNINIKEAFILLEKANKKKKDDPYITDSIGWAYYLTGNFNKAEKFLRKAVLLMPDDPIVNDHYGDILWKLDRKIQARYFWKNVLGMDDAEEELERVLGLPSYKSSISLFIVLGAVMLPLGADLVVDGAAGLAAGWGVSEAVIGLSLIALGTSLPELSTTVIAALHKSSDVAIGNVIGSNMFNILAILGITALLTEIPVDPMFLRFDLWVMFACTVMLWLFVLTKTTIRKPAGVLFLAGYLGYMYTLY